ncbi:MAG: histidine kinase N-terminal 7TM domain-containing protein [Chloroflexota bacterium]
MAVLEETLVLLNQILASFTVILALSLLAFLIAYNRQSAIGRAFSILLGCMCVTYMGDAAIIETRSLEGAIPWLKFQWIGIAFIPAAYLHFSDALLRTTNLFSKTRRGAVAGAYFVGAVFLYLAIWTDLLVRDGFFSPGITQFRSGSYFWLFSIYFVAAVGWGIINTVRVRNRCLTSATKRRVQTLSFSLAAPAFGVFPYMLLANQTSQLPASILLAALFVVNVGIAIMIMLITYNVSLFDAFAPDRVVKYRLGTFILRGPVVAGLAIFIFLIVPDTDIILGLPRDLVLSALIVAFIVLAPLAANYLKPGVSRLIYWQERDEVELLRAIDTRLVTSTDLRQALENVLTTLCELCHVRTGFVVNLVAQSGPRLEILVGNTDDVDGAIDRLDPAILKTPREETVQGTFIVRPDFWYVPLRGTDDDQILGLMAIEARAEYLNLTEDEQKVINILIERAERVLEDRRLQQDVFKALRGIVSDLEHSQQIRSAVPYVGTTIENLLQDDSPINEPDFAKMVQEALSHYWGGPKLTNSPLMQLRVVQEEIEAHDGNTVNALRSVLKRAIENVRPDGEQRMTTSEWLFYNILELKFIKGLRVRDIAGRLAMSEADFYRKQKIAIEAVARSLSEMETRSQ